VEGLGRCGAAFWLQSGTHAPSDADNCDAESGLIFSAAVFMYTPATEAVFPSIHYARSVISRSGAALFRHHKTLFNRNMEPRGDFF